MGKGNFPNSFIYERGNTIVRPTKRSYKKINSKASRFSRRKRRVQIERKTVPDRHTHTHTHADTTYFSSQREVSVSVVSPSPKVGVGHNCR